jgi:hypothetical protein
VRRRPILAESLGPLAQRLPGAIELPCDFAKTLVVLRCVIGGQKAMA